MMSRKYLTADALLASLSDRLEDESKVGQAGHTADASANSFR